MSEDCPHCVFEETEANCRGCFEGSHYKPKPITNADRIRAMSDEELAEWLEEISPHTEWKFYLQGGTWLDWIKQEVDHE